MLFERQVRAVARKKVVFVIVEGPSDEEALGVLLTRFFDKSVVYVHVVHHDITTQKGNTPANIVARVGDRIRAYAKENHFAKSDFQEIIHLIDTDGIYIPDEKVTEDPEALKPIYLPDQIRTGNRDNIILRNRQKRGNLGRLVPCHSVWDVPYRIFYMSCNLDHVLYDKPNSTDKEKEEDSHGFARQYHDDLPAFLDFISRSDFSVQMEFGDSWKFIMEGTHSLERFTNLGIRFES